MEALERMASYGSTTGDGCLFETESHWLAWNLLYRPGWSRTYRHPLACAFQVLGLKTSATILSLGRSGTFEEYF